MNKAVFSLINYKFDKVILDFALLSPGQDLEIALEPSGKFYPEDGLFNLTFTFAARAAGQEDLAIYVSCVADYKFENVRELAEIPEYFYANSIAILFPYIRAFVSTLTLQANVKPLVLPTYNISPLKDNLIQNTTVADGNRE